MGGRSIFCRLRRMRWMRWLQMTLVGCQRKTGCSRHRYDQSKTMQYTRIRRIIAIVSFLTLTLLFLHYSVGGNRHFKFVAGSKRQRTINNARKSPLDYALDDIKAGRMFRNRREPVVFDKRRFDEPKLLQSNQDKHIKERGDTVDDINKTGVATKTVSDSKHVTFKIMAKNRGCVRMIALYTPSMRPFGYWPEYSELKLMFDGARNLPGNNESFPTALVECPQHACDINIKPTDEEEVLANSDAVVLNVAPLVVRWQMAARSERFIRTLGKNNIRVIFYAMESATTMNAWDNTIKDIKYHYSMTYHSSSDIVLPYGRFVAGQPMGDHGGRRANDTSMVHTEGKTSLIAWMASNCNLTFWPRYEWVTRFRELLPVDVFGECGDMACLPKFSEKCTKKMRSYKFYLALENAQCGEYITEKFWRNCLTNGVVPVVYGGRKDAYERHAPPNSFIFMGDFSSSMDLADYLLLLDSDEKLYSQYFTWRSMGHIERFYPKLQPSAFCDLLPILSDETKTNSLEVKRVGDSGYFKACREGYTGWYTKPGDINTWAPWK